LEELLMLVLKAISQVDKKYSILLILLQQQKLLKAAAYCETRRVLEGSRQQHKA